MTTTRSPRQRSILTRMNTWILFAVLLALFSSSDAKRNNTPPLAATDGTVYKTHSLRGSDLDAARLLKHAAAPAKHKDSRQATARQTSHWNAATNKFTGNKAAKARETKKKAAPPPDEESESESEESESLTESESESEDPEDESESASESVSESEDEEEEEESVESSESEDVPIEEGEGGVEEEVEEEPPAPDQEAEASGEETKSIPASKIQNQKEVPTKEANYDDYVTPSDNIIEETDDEMDEIEEELEEELVREKKVARGLGGLGFFLAFCSMIFTAHQMSENPDGIFASVCRLAITITSCALKIVFMPCRKLIGVGNPHYNGHMPVSTNDYTYRETPHTNAGFEMS